MIDVYVGIRALDRVDTAADGVENNPASRFACASARTGGHDWTWDLSAVEVFDRGPAGAVSGGQLHLPGQSSFLELYRRDRPQCVGAVVPAAGAGGEGRFGAGGGHGAGVSGGRTGGTGLDSA